MILFSLIFMGVSILVASLAKEGLLPPVPWFVPVIFFLIGLVPLGDPIYLLMACKNTEYMITDQRVITQTGAIGLDTRFIDFDKIQEVYVEVGFIDKMLGTGSVHAVTAGYVYVGRGGASMLPTLAALKEPYAVQKLLQEAIEKARTARTR